MTTRSRLVYVPALPWDANMLMPQHRLAAIAGALRAHGHESSILDVGTLGALERMACVAGLGPGHTEESPRPGLLPWPRRGAERRRQAMLEAALDARAVEVARAVLGVARPDFVVFLVERAADLCEARRTGARLRAWAPEVAQIVAGAYAGTHARALVERDGFDAVLVGDAELGALALADRVADRAVWPRLPNVVAKDHRGLAAGGPDPSADWAALGAPDYSRAAYPALAGGEKFRLLTLEHSRGRHHAPNHQPQLGLGMRQVRVKTPAAMADEVARWADREGFRAFHFLGEATPAAQVDSLGYELLARCLRVAYSRAAHVRHLDPGTVRALARSGCRALGFRIDTGSQRLLEDFYGHDFGVSQTLGVLAACQGAGLFVATDWTFPCPNDDEHTREETLRVLTLGRPQAATLHTARCLPGSMWALQPAQFGFAPDAARRDGADMPPAMRGWSRSRVARERAWMHDRMAELGVAEGLGERAGLVARLAGHSGGEAAWHAALNEALRRMDAAAAAAMVAAFNSQASARVARRTLHAHVAAAGN